MMNRGRNGGELLVFIQWKYAALRILQPDNTHKKNKFNEEPRKPDDAMGENIPFYTELAN